MGRNGIDDISELARELRADAERKEPGPAIKLIAILLVAGVFIVDGWAIKVIWGWVAVPYFDMAAISIPLAIAIRALLSSFLGCRFTSKGMEKTSYEKCADCLTFILRPFVLVGVAWLALKFI